MNPREKKLVLAIAAALGLVVVVKVIVPRLRPMFDFDREIVRLEEKRDSYDLPLERLERAFEKYQVYFARTGSSNNEKWVGDQFYRTMDELLRQCKLTGPRMTPKEPSTDRKTGLITLGYGFRAEGELRDAILFMKLFYEQPYVTRFKDVKITPKKGRAGGPNDSVTLTGNIDVLVPPKPDAPVPLDPEYVMPPIQRPIRGDYALIWDRDPFNPPAKPEPPPEPVIVERDPDPDPPPPAPVPGARRDPQGAQKMIRMCVQTPSEELLVFNTASKQREFVTKGQEIDGGKLLMVHPLGALVRRMDNGQDHHFLYPIGESLADSMRIDQAERFPELRTVARHYLKEERKRQQAAEQAAERAAAIDTSARDAARRAVYGSRPEAAGGLPAWVGPPPDFGSRGPDADAMFPPAELMGPPESLAGDGNDPTMPQDAADDDEMMRRVTPPAPELMGPAAELAGPESQPPRRAAPIRKTPPRRSRVQRPAGPE